MWLCQGAAAWLMVPAAASLALFVWLLTLRSAPGGGVDAATALVRPCVVGGEGLSLIKGGAATAVTVSRFAPYRRRYSHNRKNAWSQSLATPAFVRGPTCVKPMKASCIPVHHPARLDGAQPIQEGLRP